MFRIAVKGVFAHKARLSMTALAVVMGVGFVSGTYVFTDSIQRSFDDLFTSVNQGVDLYVRGSADFGVFSPRIDEGLVDQVSAVPGVVVAAPSVGGIAQFVDDDGDPIGGNGPPTLGFSYVPGGDGLTPVEIREGDWPRQPHQVVVDSYTADANGLSVGDMVDVIVPVGVEGFTISGIVTFGDADNLLGATLAIFEFETAQRVFGAEGQVDSIAVAVAADSDPGLVRAQISDFLPDGAEVVSAAEQTEEDLDEVAEGLSFLSTILLVIGGVGVFVGAFTIQNTFRIIVAQRTRELALLRAVGATAGQVTRMVVIEALIVGLVASVVGVGAGFLIALGLKAVFAGAGFGIPSSDLVLLTRTVVVGMTVGVLVTVVSALVPARKASQVPPIAALRDVLAAPRSLGTRVAAGTAVTAIGVGLLLLGLLLALDNAIAFVGVGALIAFVGVSMLAPLVAAKFARFAGAPLPRFRGIVGRLAQENAIRRPRRTAATASALMIGVALVSIIAVFQASAKAAVGDAFSQDYETDFQVRLTGFADPRSAGLPATLADELAAVDGVGLVVRDRVGEYRSGPDGREKFLLGVDGPLAEVVVLEMRDGSSEGLAPGTALLSVAEAADFGVGVGEVLRIQVPGADVDLTVAGVFESSPLGFPLIIDMTTYEEHFEFNLDRFIYIQVEEGADRTTVRPAIAAVTDSYPNSELTNTEELIADTEDQIDGILNFLVVLLGFALIIALAGIVNTLALSISERKREIGLLRAVGMQRRQVRSMIRWEAVLIAVFGGVLGLVVGTLLGSAIVLAVGQGLTLALPWPQLVLYLVVAAVGGIVAAWAPARRGARLEILEAIAHE